MLHLFDAIVRKVVNMKGQLCRTSLFFFAGEGIKNDSYLYGKSPWITHMPITKAYFSEKFLLLLKELMTYFIMDI